MTTAFITFCHPPKYVEKLHRPGVLRAMVESHTFPFDDTLVIHNQCKAGNYAPFNYPCRTINLPREEFEPLMQRWGVDPYNEDAERLTHGEGAAHWHVVHNVNHLFGLENTDTDFIVFADCDTHMKSQPPGQSWVNAGMGVLRNKPEVLIVSPGDGGQVGGSCAEGGQWSDGTRLTRNVSQQLFLCRADEFKNKVDFDVPWNGEFDAPGGPFAEWYFLLEGKLGRYMNVSDQWRAILPDKFRYWHTSNWGDL